MARGSDTQRADKPKQVEEARNSRVGGERHMRNFMVDENEIQQFFGELEGTGWRATVKQRPTDVCVSVEKPSHTPMPLEFCGLFDDALAQARQYVATSTLESEEEKASEMSAIGTQVRSSGWHHRRIKNHPNGSVAIEWQRLVPQASDAESSTRRIAGSDLLDAYRNAKKELLGESGIEEARSIKRHPSNSRYKSRKICRSLRAVVRSNSGITTAITTGHTEPWATASLRTALPHWAWPICS